MSKSDAILLKDGSVLEDPIVDMFTCSTPTADMLHRMDVIKAAFVIAAKTVHEHCPAGADRTAIMRKLNESHLMARHAIIHKGRSYR